MNSLNITLGTTSIHKIDAVKEACANLGIEASVSGIKASSGQNEQPVGFEETYGGALARATEAKNQNPDSIAIGIESGIFRFGTEQLITLDVAVVVILTDNGRQIVTTSEGIQFPEDCVSIAEKRGFEATTVGSVITEKLGGDPTDPHSVLTDGKVTRKMTLVDAVTVALRQL